MRARRKRDDRALILKLLTGEASPERLAAFRREYEIAARLPEEAVVQPLALDSLDRYPALAMPDLGLTSCDRLIGEAPFTPSEATALAAGVARALAAIHNAGVVHKDVTPGNIVYDPASGTVRLIDFGLASELARESAEALPATALAGTLAYIAPEQTGRLNRGIDYRCDFYSLGASFMELLTGKPPFESGDSLALVHAHLAQTPPAPSSRNDAVPAQLDAVVARMLAKTPEARYQTAQALADDLEACRAALAQNTAIPAFTPGARDIPRSLQIPQELYGRAEQVQALEGAFALAGRGQRVLALVTGDPGIGKSALVQELHRPVTAHGGIFLAGKFDQLAAERPYSALAQALQGLIAQLLAEPEDRLAAWQERLAAALQGNGGVLARLVPDIESLLGAQPTPAALDPEAERNRFALTLQRFLGAIAGPDHPVVLFLDDLQWADAASLDLLEGVLADAEQGGYLCVVGAYRPEEVDSGHPVRGLQERAEAAGAAVTDIELTGLAEADVSRLIADALHSTPEDVADLARQAQAKTLGNPFFLERLLARWAVEGLLWPDPAAGHWRWDGEAIAHTAIADNVVALMTEKLAALPQGCQDKLALAAVLGGEVDLAHLATVAQASPAEVLESLWPALKEDILRPLDDSYKFVGEEGHSGHARLQFRHDKVQQAAAEMLDTPARRSAQLAAGRLILAEVADPETDDRLFEALGHLNAVAPDIAEAGERLRLGQLNAVAARRARRAAAHDRAMGFVRSGLAFLGERPWERDYATALALHELGAEAAVVAYNLEELFRFTDAVLAQARQRRDTVAVRSLRLVGYALREEPGAGMREGLAGLRQFGVNIPERPSPIRVLAGYAYTRWVLRKRDPMAQLDAPTMTDPDRCALAELMGGVISPSLLSAPLAGALINQHLVRLLVRYGNGPRSVYGFGTYALFLLALGRPIAEAQKFLSLARSLSDRWGETTERVNVDANPAFVVEGWLYSPAAFTERVAHACDRARLAGNAYVAGHLTVQVVLGLYITGGRLDTAVHQARTYLAVHHKIWPRGTAGTIGALVNFLENLYTPTVDPVDLPRGYAGFDDLHDLDSVYERLSDAGYREAAYPIVIVRTELAFQFQRFDGLDRWLRRLRALGRGTIRSVVNLRGGCALIWAEASSYRGQAPARARRRLGRDLRHLEKRLANAPHPEFYVSWVALARAEVARVSGQTSAALGHYDTAATYADAHEQYDMAGAARERAGDLLLARGLKTLAAPYLHAAAASYAAMAAHGKLADLEARYGIAVPGEPAAEESPTRSLRSATTGGTPTRRSTTSGSTGQEPDLDLDAVIRAAQTISQEIRPEALIESLMRTVGHTAGATHGVLLLGDREAELGAQARLDVEAEPDVAILANVAAARAQNRVPVPLAVLRYVLRTRELVVLDDPNGEARYGTDRYLQAVRPRSLLALPLVNQGRVSGVLYLEHRSSPGAFPESRANVLSLLSAQMAISLENARLYASMEDRVARRTEELEAEKAETERAHRVIQDSLETARRMQRAALPAAGAGELGLADLAIWWEPRDQVGGDFYRLRASADGREIALVLMDCTGHGVPGALISFIASSAADRALAEATAWDPAALLAQIDRLVREELHGGSSASIADDGLEAGICVLDTETGRLRFAGAGIHLFVETEQGPRLVRGVRGALGYRSVAAPELETTRLGSQGGRSLVIPTDGLLEQTGGPKRLQLGRSRFARLLQDTAGSDSLAERLTRIQSAFAAWQSNEPQRDDLTLIAFRPR